MDLNQLTNKVMDLQQRVEHLENIVPDPTKLATEVEEVGYDEHHPDQYVVLPCNGNDCEVSQTEFKNVEEDIAGRDNYTFTCPECGGEHTTLVFTR